MSASAENIEEESGTAPRTEVIDHWKDQKWLKTQFPFQKGKGKQQPPLELLHALASDSERAAAVLRWRNLTSEEQWIERETLGHKKPRPRQKVTHREQSAGDADNDITDVVTGLASLNIARGEVEYLQEEVVQAVINQETPVDSTIRYVGYLDIEENRINQAIDLVTAKNKTQDFRIIGTSPVTKAQVKDRATTKVRASLVQKLYTYIKMTTPLDFDLKGNSTKDWPKLKVALVVVDGFKPNPANGGRRKEGTERRSKVMVAFMSGSEDDCAEVLHAIKEGIICNTQGSSHPEYECCYFAYNYTDAVAADRKHDQILPLNTCASPEECNTEEPRFDWTNQASILDNFPIWKGRGNRPVPMKYLEQFQTDAARKKAVFSWRRFTQKAQLELESRLNGANTVVNSTLGRQSHVDSIESSDDTAVSPLEPPDQSDRREKTSSKRIVESPPVSKAQIKDKVVTRIRNDLIKRLFVYISMTTPSASVVNELQSGDWPRLKAGIIIVDEFKPNPTKGGAAYKDGEERRAKKLITFITGSEDDRNEILEALDDGILTNNEKRRLRYDPVFACNVKDANGTEYYGFESVRKRPPTRVLSIDEILPSINYHWQLIPSSVEF